MVSPRTTKGNIRADELAAFKLLASELFAVDAPAIAEALRAGALMEIDDCGRELQE